MQKYNSFTDLVNEMYILGPGIIIANNAQENCLSVIQCYWPSSHLCDQKNEVSTFLARNLPQSPKTVCTARHVVLSIFKAAEPVSSGFEPL